MESPRDGKDPAKAGDEDELEQREFSSPPCYLHELEQQQKDQSGQVRKKPGIAPDSADAKEPKPRR